MVSSRIIWVFCLIAAALLYLFSDSYLAPVVLTAVVVVPIVGIVINQLFSRSLSTELSTFQTVEKEEELACKLVTINRLPVPLSPLLCRLRCKNLLTGEMLDTKTMFSVGAKRSYEFSVEYTSKYCGSLEITIEEFRAFDVFGLFSTKHQMDARAEAVVLPKTFSPSLEVLPNLSKNLEADEYSQIKAGADPSETFAIRDYVPGDSLKRIHWKLTNKFDTYMVKELALPIHHSFLVLLETSYPSDMNGDEAVADALGEILVTICQTLIQAEISFDVAWKDNKEEVFRRFTISTMDDLTGLLNKLLSAYAVAEKGDAFTYYTEEFGSFEFEHIVYLSRFIPTSIETFAGDGRATAIVCAEGGASTTIDTTEGYRIYYCTPTTYETVLVSLEI